MAAQIEENENWLPWEFKRQRPDKIPGCQDTSWLPTLDVGQSTCGEGQQCYYFSCGKCSSSVALGMLNSRYKSELEYIPLLSPSKVELLLLCFVVFSLSRSGYLVFSKYFRFNVLVGCEVPRLDLLQVISSTTPKAIEELVNFPDF